MASVNIKTGAGRQSPYWNAKLKGPGRHGLDLETKLRKKKLATRLEASGKERRRWRAMDTSTHEKAQKVLAECEVDHGGDGLKKSQEFIDQCLRQPPDPGSTSRPQKSISTIGWRPRNNEPHQFEHAEAICSPS